MRGLAIAAISAMSMLRGAEWTTGAAYRAGVEKYRAERAEAIGGEDGWLSVAGLTWLHPGENTVGADPANDVVLPDGAAPASTGAVSVTPDGVFFTPAPDVAVTLNGQPVTGRSPFTPTVAKNPDIFHHRDLRFLLLKLGDRYAFRLKDNNHVLKRNFKGLRWYDIDPKWRVEAKLIAPESPRQLVMNNIVGEKDVYDSAGFLEFELDGNPLRLEAAKRDDGLFIVFRDGTSGRSTYGGARFLYADMPTDGKVALDFNRAVNPPCAFSPYTTCPVPPAHNRLAVRIEAGELKP